jgi:hypothetical protein
MAATNTPITYPEWKNKRRRDILASDEQVAPIHGCFSSQSFWKAESARKGVPDRIESQKCWRDWRLEVNRGGRRGTLTPIAIDL